MGRPCQADPPSSTALQALDEKSGIAIDRAKAEEAVKAVMRPNTTRIASNEHLIRAGEWPLRRRLRAT